MAFLIAGILFLGNWLGAESAISNQPTGSGTNRTDTSTGRGLRSGSATNAPATDKQLRAILMQRERLDVLSAQLNELLTKYTEKDKRVRIVRKQIADVQKQLAREPAATLPAGNSGTNRTAKASNAITNVRPLTSPATSGGINAIAKTTNAAAKAVLAITRGTNAPASTNVSVNLESVEKNHKSNKPVPAVVSGASKSNVERSTPAPSLSSDPGMNAAANTNASAKLVSMETLDDKYRLAIGDKLSFRIEEDKHRLVFGDKLSVRTEDDPTPLLVTDSGELEVPYIGRYPAENKTCKQLAYELEAALEKDYFYKATVILAVDLKAKSLGRVYLTGAVHVPGPLDIPSDEVLTLGKAILRAGGFTDFAERHSVKVTRKAAGSSEAKTLVVDVAQVFDKGKTELDLPLEPGDLILVPERLVRF